MDVVKFVFLIDGNHYSLVLCLRFTLSSQTLSQKNLVEFI